LAHTFRLKKQVSGSKGGEEASNSNSLANYSFSNLAKLKYVFDMYTLKSKIGNEAINYEIGAKPKEYNTADSALAVKHAGKYEPVTGLYETTNGVKYGSPNVGPVRFWGTFDHVWNNKGKSNLKPSLNVQIQDEYHVGFKFEHDLAANALKSAFGVIAWKTLSGDYWFKSECLKHHLILGCHHKHSPKSW